MEDRKEKRDKRIPVLVTRGESERIREKAQQANMSAGSYMRTAALSGEKIEVVDKSGMIVRYLGNICSAVQTLEYHFPGTRDYLEDIKMEVTELWHLLK